MASLMTIPEELRDTIIELVLLDKRTPPPDIEMAKPRRAIKRTRWNGIASWDYGPSNVLFETTSIRTSSGALLLVNRAVHEQTKQALARLSPDGIKYKLDVMFVNEQQLWPTWLQVPTFSKQVDTVDVTVRIFGRNTISRRSEFLCGDGSPPQIVWVFYWLMEHFLDFGVANAAGFEEGQPHPRNIEVSVKTINLNFVSGEPDLVPVNTEEQEEKWWVRQRSRSREARQPRSDSALLAAAEPLRMHPKWLAEFVGRDIASLPYMGYHGTPYGAIIHERIGCVKVYAEGELVNEVNPGAILAAMVEKPDQGSDWYSSGTFGHLGGDCRLLTFWNWKYQTVVQRQRLGLPLVGPLLWPALDDLKGWRAARDEYRQSNNVSRQCNDRCLCRDRRLEEMLEKGVEPVNS